MKKRQFGEHFSNLREAIAAAVVAPLLIASQLAWIKPGYAAVYIPECEFEVIGTKEPPTSGSPTVISNVTGTVISANFFNSGAIELADGSEYVSVCVSPYNSSGGRIAEITTDIGLDNDFQIKAYPQFVVGTKFGNQYETSFRYYNNTGLSADQKWPVRSINTDKDGKHYEFANLEYISNTRSVSLPAFTTNLPDISITLDIDEFNVVGSERDIMLESWFHDTASNWSVIGLNSATGLPIAGTLNNVVGIGHQHYPELDNTILEMMVHIAPLSPNDVSGAQNNPGQNQLTENFSGKDYDADGIDDHFDVDSHQFINSPDPSHPDPGKYSSGIDIDPADGIDDADVLPVVIGDYAYSIWYGESFLSPIVIYSRETNASLNSDFNQNIPDMDLTTEGEISLNWNDFIQFTMSELQPLLQTEGVDWAQSNSNTFSRINSPYSAINGVEFGVEPQTNAPSDQPYTVVINKLEFIVNDKPLGLGDHEAPLPEITTPATSEHVEPSASFTISGKVKDEESGVRRVSVRVARQDTSPIEYWNGVKWQTSPDATFIAAVVENDTWSLPGVDLSNEGKYRVRVNARDNAGNIRRSNENPIINFEVIQSDTLPPIASTAFPSNGAALPLGTYSLTGNASDDSSNVDRILVRIQLQDQAPKRYWNGSAFQDEISWQLADLYPDGSWGLSDINFSIPGNYKVLLRAFDSAGNQSISSQNPTTAFTIISDDITDPFASVSFPVNNDTLPDSVLNIEGTYYDTDSGVAKVLIKLQTRDSDPQLYWNGSNFQTSPVWVNAALVEPEKWVVNITEWSSPRDYQILIRAIDFAGNQSTSSQNPSTLFSIQ